MSTNQFPQESDPALLSVGTLPHNALDHMRVITRANTTVYADFTAKLNEVNVQHLDSGNEPGEIVDLLQVPRGLNGAVMYCLLTGDAERRALPTLIERAYSGTASVRKQKWHSYAPQFGFVLPDDTVVWRRTHVGGVTKNAVDHAVAEHAASPRRIRLLSGMLDRMLGA